MTNGSFYLIDIDTKEQLIIADDGYYTDFEILFDKEYVFLATDVRINIFTNNTLVKIIQVDNIDGIRFLNNNDSKQIGEFRNISSVDFDDWIKFELDIKSLDFYCDKGRMWNEWIINGENIEQKYITMDLKSKSN